MLFVVKCLEAVDKVLWSSARATSFGIEEAEPGVTRIDKSSLLVVELVAHLEAHHRYLLDNNADGQHLVEVGRIDIL